MVLVVFGLNDVFYMGSLFISGVGLVINFGVMLFGNDSYSGNVNLLLFMGINVLFMGLGMVDGCGDIIIGMLCLV